MLNFCNSPANSRHNAALLPFDFARSVFLLIQQLFAYFLINTHIFITVLFRKPFSSFSASIAKSPFNRNYPETPCYPPTENRPNIPRNSDRFHPRTFFRIILFPFHSERYKPISRQFPLISEQKRPKARFRTLGPDWFFW